MLCNLDMNIRCLVSIGIKSYMLARLEVNNNSIRLLVTRQKQQQQQQQQHSSTSSFQKHHLSYSQVEFQEFVMIKSGTHMRGFGSSYQKVWVHFIISHCIHLTISFVWLGWANQYSRKAGTNEGNKPLDLNLLPWKVLSLQVNLIGLDFTINWTIPWGEINSTDSSAIWPSSRVPKAFHD